MGGPRATPFGCVLVANRGEIAARIQRSCRALGLGVVAVFSDADAGAPWVRSADRAVRLGPAPSRDSYLAIDRLLAAARAAGADAVHPGYGFLSEDAGFAAACAAAGLVFVGPPADVIRRLGSKIEAKALARAAGVPVVPEFDPGDRDALRFPLLVKASAGGGGKGMRVVRAEGELDAAMAAGRREAAAAFGDDALLLERFVERARHVEVQLLGDRHGAVVALGARDCSIQRRHQKVVEESPPADLAPALLGRLCDAAVALGRAVGYEGAGTVEFVVAPDGAFYFLEVNTRLQVEHPVTELVTGLDLVAWQLRIARGEPLAPVLATIGAAPRGHAVEARLYAEDPAAGFLPTIGRLLDLAWPELPGVRIDAGPAAGDGIGVDYDPLIAKVVAHADDRAAALALLAAALERTSVLGVVTNRELLVRALRHPALVAGAVDTGFLAAHPTLAAPPPPEPAGLARAAIAAVVAGVEARRAARAILPTLAPGFRNVPGEQRVTFRHGDVALEVAYAVRPDGAIAIRVGADARVVRIAWSRPPELALEELADDAAVSVVRRYRVVRGGEAGDDGGDVWVHDGAASFALVEAPRFPPRAAEAIAGGTTAPMPGRVVEIRVSPGDVVAAGAALVVLEAMKMEHTVTATATGVVDAVLVAAGDQVAAGAPLVVIR